MTERRALQMHPQLLKDVVFRQAGSRDKAVLEGVMNSVDAGATKIEIHLDQERLRIHDNGKGFATRKEIIANFETFGTPHQEGDAVYGRFRMGRGQLFAFGKNEWWSHRFLMKVDAKQELAYDLSTTDFIVGCHITVEWYDKLYLSELDELDRLLKRAVKYVNVPVLLNGTPISVDPEKESWDVVQKDYYIKFKDRGSLEVYNLGVFVRDYPAADYSTGGTVVARKQLQVNFARNDVQSSCPIWTRIKRDLRGKAIKRSSERVSKVLTDSERQFYVDALKQRELDPEKAARLKLLVDVTGRAWSQRELVSHMTRHGISRVTVADTHDMRGDKLMQQNQAIVFSREILDTFNVGSLAALLETMGHAGLSLPGQAISFKEAAASLLGDHVEIPKSKWTLTERAVVRNLYSHYLTTLVRELYPYQGDWSDYGKKHKHFNSLPRDIRIGESDVADAWTDGKTYIVLTRKLIGRSGQDVSGWFKLALVMLHEYCHDDPTTDSHVHTPEFFRRFHDVHARVAEYGAHLATTWGEILRKENRRVNKTLMKNVNRLEKARRMVAVAWHQQEIEKELRGLEERLRAKRAEIDKKAPTWS